MFVQKFLEIICIVCGAAFALAFLFIGLMVVLYHEKFASQEMRNKIIQPSVRGVSLTSMAAILCVIVVIDIPLIVLVSVVYDSSSKASTVINAFDFATWNLLVCVILTRCWIYFRIVIAKDSSVYKWHSYIKGLIFST